MKSKRILSLVLAAVLCSPVWSQPALAADPLDSFSGKSGAIRDTLRGVSVTAPAGWSVRDAKRWGTNESTIWFVAPNTSSVSPSLYYRTYDEAPAMPAGAEAYLKAEAQAKAKARTEGGLTDYKIRPNTFLFRTINGYPALSFTADFTQGSEKRAEYQTRVLGAKSKSLFFMMGADWGVEACARNSTA